MTSFIPFLQSALSYAKVPSDASFDLIVFNAVSDNHHLSVHTALK